MLCTPESLGRLQKTLVSVCMLFDARPRGALDAYDCSSAADTNEVRSAFDVLMQCRMLPMLLESFVGALIVPWYDSRCLNSRTNQSRRGHALPSAFDHK